MILQGAHLVGSVPLADATSVFTTVATRLGRHLHTLPDGETGPRKDWIAWQYSVLAGTPGFEPVPVGDRGYLRRQLVHLTGARTAPTFGSLGYADAALASYAIFERLQRAGTIPRDVRFQVSLPTPLAPITVFVDHGDRAVVEPAYEATVVSELARIADAIPHDRLAIQWDVAVEVALMEHAWPAHFADVATGIRERLTRLALAVPRDVAVGFHLCYGDFGHHHFTNPTDASTLVTIANALATIDRALAWIHMPVPLAWTRREAFAPLGQLALPAATRLYLGVVHLADGITGTRARLALANEFVSACGIATECGWGRRPMDSVEPLLDLHAAALAPQ